MAGIRQTFTPGITAPLLYRVQPGEKSIRLDLAGWNFTGASGQLQGSNDGATWTPIAVIDLSDYDSKVDLAPANGRSAGYVVAAVYSQYRFVPGGLTTGTLIVAITGLFDALAPIVAHSAMFRELRRSRVALGALIETDLAEAIPG